MIFTKGRFGRCLPMVVTAFLLVLPGKTSGSQILGEVKLIPAGKIEKLAGIWVDDLHLGYLKELKGKKKLLLLPGEHRVVARHAGYLDFTQSVVVEPGEQQIVRVALQKDPEATRPQVTAEVKLSVKPNRAAVFYGDRYVGHVDEFDGPGQALLVAPGKMRIKIALAGYQTFETELNLLPNQKFELKTELFKGSISQASPLIKGDQRP